MEKPVEYEDEGTISRLLNGLGLSKRYGLRISDLRASEYWLGQYSDDSRSTTQVSEVDTSAGPQDGSDGWVSVDKEDL